MKYKLEIACFNLESAIIAQDNGADRIELCESFAEGGITPGQGVIESAAKKITAELFIMIRPRGGDFVYSDEEFEQMKKDILYFKSMNVNGFVFGILDITKAINIKQNTELVKLAFPLHCTFHRAFDAVSDPLKALEDIIACGFKTILTSAQKKAAVDGIAMLKQFVGLSKGRIEIMPGGGVRSSNIALLKNELGVRYYHSSAIMQGDLADALEITALKNAMNQ